MISGQTPFFLIRPSREHSFGRLARWLIWLADHHLDWCHRPNRCGDRRFGRRCIDRYCSWPSRWHDHFSAGLARWIVFAFCAIDDPPHSSDSRHGAQDLDKDGDVDLPSRPARKHLCCCAKQVHWPHHRLSTVTLPMDSQAGKLSLQRR